MAHSCSILKFLLKQFGLFYINTSLYGTSMEYIDIIQNITTFGCSLHALSISNI